jgi:hypothetical protein
VKIIEKKLQTSCVYVVFSGDKIDPWRQNRYGTLIILIYETNFVYFFGFEVLEIYIFYPKYFIADLATTALLLKNDSLRN